MSISINTILEFLQAEGLEHEYYGIDDLVVEGFCALTELKPKSITWIKKIDNYDLSLVENTVELLFITNVLPADLNISGYNLIITSNPKGIYFEILNKFFPPLRQAQGIAPTATVKTKKIGKEVSIGHNCYICEDVAIGDNVIIRNNVVIECPTVIGNDCVIESGIVIGADGYGYYTINDKCPRKVPDYGGVRIGDRVAIGANTCIDRGTLADTIIEDDVKIDNLCHIAHNVHIKPRSYVVALSMIAGSTVIEEDAYIAPGALVINQIEIGRNAVVGMGSVVTKSVEANKVVVGMPAKVLRDNE